MEFGNDSPFLQDDYAEYALHLKEVAEECGISFNQAHAPFAMDMSVWETDPEAWEDVLLRIRRSIEIAGIVGAPRIVVHPVQYMIYWNTDPQEMLDKNRAFYGLLIDTAKKAGVTNDMEHDEICEKMIEQFTSMTFDGLTGKGMTWAATGEVSKSPMAVVIENGVYVGAR